MILLIVGMNYVRMMQNVPVNHYPYGKILRSKTCLLKFEQEKKTIGIYVWASEIHARTSELKTMYA